MAERWISVAEAAKALGVSATTVRRRAQREQLESRIGDEGRLEIRLPALATEADTAGATAPPTQRSTHEPTAATAASEQDREAEGSDATAADQMSPNPGKFGHYSPLPHGGVGITPQSVGKLTARLTPGDLLGSGGDASDTGPEAELRRYQRLAGASMILAQRQADEAHEQVSLIRGESHAWRRWCQGAWAGVAVVLLLAMFIVGVVGHRASTAQAALQVHEQSLENARDAAAHSARERDELQKLVRQLERQLNDGIRDRNAAVR